MSEAVNEFEQAVARIIDAHPRPYPKRKFLKLYLGSTVLGLCQRDLFRNVNSYLLFIGTGRSGSTLVGSLLDAHPQITVSTELDSLQYMKLGFGRLQIFYFIQRNAKYFAQGGSKWTGYSYEIPGQWQGRSSGLKVIGDKKAARTTDILAKSYSIERVQNKIGLPLKFIHTVRNPYDNISTLTLRWAQKFGIDSVTHEHLSSGIKYYFQQIALSSNFIQGRDNVVTVPLEKLISNPAETLTGLCKFLDVDAPEDYVEACASKLFSKPKKTRFDLPWDSELNDRVRSESQAYDFLADYSYDR